jgi:hypothetical protein
MLSFQWQLTVNHPIVLPNREMTVLVITVLESIINLSILALLRKIKILTLIFSTDWMELNNRAALSITIQMWPLMLMTMRKLLWIGIQPLQSHPKTKLILVVLVQFSIIRILSLRNPLSSKEVLKNCLLLACLHLQKLMTALKSLEQTHPCQPQVYQNLKTIKTYLLIRCSSNLFEKKGSLKTSLLISLVI